jgi:hypothetical protein
LRRESYNWWPNTLLLRCRKDKQWFLENLTMKINFQGYFVITKFESNITVLYIFLYDRGSMQLEFIAFKIMIKGISPGSAMLLKVQFQWLFCIHTFHTNMSKIAKFARRLLQRKLNEQRAHRWAAAFSA